MKKICLVYHAIGENNKFMSVDFNQFQLQINYLVRKKFEFCHIEELLNKNSGNNVSIIFDDALPSSEIAMQYLEKMNIKYSIGVIENNSVCINFKKLNNLEIMKFKSKYNKNSYTISSNKSINNPNIILDLKRKTITLPHLENIKIRGYKKLKEIKGRIINVTISKEPTGKYYVSVLYELTNVNPIKNPKNIVGIDIGIKQLLTLSDGTTYENIHIQEKYRKRIKRKQRELSRKVKRSNNYYKCKKELAK